MPGETVARFKRWFWRPPRPHAERLAVVYRPFNLALVAGAAAAIVVGWMRPAPWLLALLLGMVLSTLWFFAVSRFLRADAWGEERSGAG
jgi:hypothetical protein